MNAERFWSHVQIRRRGCWLWRGAINEDTGYGRVRRRGQIRAAHRIAYELSTGVPVPPDAIVRQRCGERRCCRPDHLEILSVVRLTNDQISAIRASFLGSRRLAPIYGVTDRHIRRVRPTRAAGYWK